MLFLYTSSISPETITLLYFDPNLSGNISVFPTAQNETDSICAIEDNTSSENNIQIMKISNEIFPKDNDKITYKMGSKQEKS